MNETYTHQQSVSEQIQTLISAAREVIVNAGWDKDVKEWYVDPESFKELEAALRDIDPNLLP